MRKHKKILRIGIGSLVLIILCLLGYSYVIPPGRHFDYESEFLKENQTEFVEVNGVKIHYLQKGNGEPLILIHGGGAWLYAFRNNIDELSKYFTVYALDMPGHGYTEYSEEDTLDLQYVGEVLKGFMDKKNIKKASFAGHSWGGGWALYFAQEYPDQVNKLILIDSSGLEDSVEQDQSIWPLMNYPFIGELLVHFITFQGVRDGYAVNDKSKIEESVYKEYYKPLTFSRNLRSQYNYQRNLDWSITGSKLSEMITPILIIWGEKDSVLPVKMAYEYEKRCKNAQLQIIENTGHMPHEEKPDEVNTLIIGFIKSP